MGGNPPFVQKILRQFVSGQMRNYTDPPFAQIVIPRIHFIFWSGTPQRVYKTYEQARGAGSWSRLVCGALVRRVGGSHLTGAFFFCAQTHARRSDTHALPRPSLDIARARHAMAPAIAIVPCPRRVFPMLLKISKTSNRMLLKSENKSRLGRGHWTRSRWIRCALDLPAPCVGFAACRRVPLEKEKI